MDSPEEIDADKRRVEVVLRGVAQSAWLLSGLTVIVLSGSLAAFLWQAAEARTQRVARPRPDAAIPSLAEGRRMGHGAVSKPAPFGLATETPRKERSVQRVLKRGVHLGADTKLRAIGP